MPALNDGEIRAPVHAQRFRRQFGVGVHQMRRVLQEQDARHPRPAHGLQQRQQMRPHQSPPVRQRQHASPGVEHLHGVGAGPGLGDQIVRHGAGELGQQLAEQARRFRREGPQPGKAGHAPAFHQIGGQRPGSAAETEQRRLRRQFAPYLAQGGHHLRRQCLGGRRAQTGDVRRGADRVRQHGARVEVEVHAEGRQGAHDVREHDGRIKGEAAQRQQRHFRRQRRRARQRLEVMGAPQFAVLRQVASRLAHDPRWPPRHRPPLERRQQQPLSHVPGRSVPA